MCQLEEELFAALARAAKQSVSEFDEQSFSDTAWTYVEAKQPAPVFLDPISLLDLNDVQEGPELVLYQMSMQCLAITDQISQVVLHCSSGRRSVGRCLILMKTAIHRVVCC